MEAYEIIRRPLVTEKALRGQEGFGSEKRPVYSFAVDQRANKHQIARAIEEIFKVKVGKVRTMRMQGKKTRMRFRQGRRPGWKKAMVTLREGRIEIL